MVERSFTGARVEVPGPPGDSSLDLTIDDLTRRLEAVLFAEASRRTRPVDPARDERSGTHSLDLSDHQIEILRADSPLLVEPVDQKTPQVRLGVVLGDLGDHHEPDPLPVGLDPSHPWHYRPPVDHLGEEGVCVGIGHRCDELLLRVSLELLDLPVIVDRDLDEPHVGRRIGRAIPPVDPVVP
jgi:hypothetical protein